MTVEFTGQELDVYNTWHNFFRVYFSTIKIEYNVTPEDIHEMAVDSVTFNLSDNPDALAEVMSKADEFEGIFTEHSEALKGCDCNDFFDLAMMSFISEGHYKLLMERKKESGQFTP